MSACRRLRCPACGAFGRAARRRAEFWSNVLHVNWARALAAASRSRRARPDGLIAVTNCRQLGPTYAEMMTEWWHRILLDHDTADDVADVVGPLTYEEQSQMIGDPIADVLRRETEDDR